MSELKKPFDEAWGAVAKAVLPQVAGAMGGGKKKQGKIGMAGGKDEGDEVKMVSEIAPALALPAAGTALKGLATGAAAVGGAMLGKKAADSFPKPKSTMYDDWLKKPTKKKSSALAAPAPGATAGDDSKSKATATPGKTAAPPKTGTQQGSTTASGSQAQAKSKADAQAKAKADAKAEAKAEAKTKTKTKSNNLKKLGAGALGLGALSGIGKGKRGDLDKSGVERSRKEVKLKKEELEFVCDFLIDHGYASTGPQAERIYEHMSSGWKDFILDS